MYYIWDYDTRVVTDNFFACGIEQFEGWADVPWMFAEKITRDLPVPLKYFTDSKLIPEDYPMTGGTQFLVSQKILSILHDLKIPNIDYYASLIERQNGEIIDNYYTINILNELDCVDFKKSKTKVKKYGPIETFDFVKMVLDHNKIPEEIKLFRIHDRKTIVVAHEDIVKACERDKVTGIDFIPVSEYQD